MGTGGLDSSEYQGPVGGGPDAAAAGGQYPGMSVNRRQALERGSATPLLRSPNTGQVLPSAVAPSGFCPPLFQQLPPQSMHTGSGPPGRTEAHRPIWGWPGADLASEPNCFSSTASGPAGQAGSAQHMGSCHPPASPSSSVPACGAQGSRSWHSPCQGRTGSDVPGVHPSCKLASGTPERSHISSLGRYSYFK